MTIKEKRIAAAADLSQLANRLIETVDAARRQLDRIEALGGLDSDDFDEGDSEVADLRLVAANIAIAGAAELLATIESDASEAAPGISVRQAFLAIS